MFPKLIWKLQNTSCGIKVLWLGTELNQCQKELKINIFFLEVAKTNTKKETLEKPKNEKLLLLIPENIDDWVLSVCKTRISTEYKENGIRCFKN